MTRPSRELRRQVFTRARGRCEYCLIDQAQSMSTHQVDHMLPQKHQGATTFDNLAVSCALCNRRKGSDLSAVDPDSGEIVVLYNPRQQFWSEHFQLEGSSIVGKTNHGRATVELLQMNTYERCLERAELQAAGKFPTT